MDTTTKVKNPETRKQKRVTSVFEKVFGGEFLLSPQMRSWYCYILFLLILVILLMVSEQNISNKKKTITKLESKYRVEISKLKANNQFIPYEENKILIQKLQDQGFVFDDDHNFTIRVKNQDGDGKRHWFKKRKNNAEQKEQQK